MYLLLRLHPFHHRQAEKCVWQPKLKLHQHTMSAYPQAFCNTHKALHRWHVFRLACLPWTLPWFSYWYLLPVSYAHLILWIVPAGSVSQNPFPLFPVSCPDFLYSCLLYTSAGMSTVGEAHLLAVDWLGWTCYLFDKLGLFVAGNWTLTYKISFFWNFIWSNPIYFIR